MKLASHADGLRACDAFLATNVRGGRGTRDAPKKVCVGGYVVCFAVIIRPSRKAIREV